jgi:ribosomal protein S18 acetylase RimI-like enzyme
MIAIRPTRDADYDALAQVWAEGWVLPEAGVDEPPPGIRSELRERLSREVAAAGWSLFAAEDNGRIVGLLGISRAESVLNQLFVASTRRSQGIGKTMLDFAKQEMAAGFTLRTRIENVRAQRFYEREGLKATHNAPHPRFPEAIFRHYRWS